MLTAKQGRSVRLGSGNKEANERADDDGKTKRTVEYPPGKETSRRNCLAQDRGRNEGQGVDREHLEAQVRSSRRKKSEQSNYITDIGAKWYRNYFYFFTTYACPSPNALSPTFEWKFARMEPLGDGTFALYAMRYTGKEWVGVFDALTVDECMKAIQDDEWFAL